VRGPDGSHVIGLLCSGIACWRMLPVVSAGGRAARECVDRATSPGGAPYALAARSGPHPRGDGPAFGRPRPPPRVRRSAHSSPNALLEGGGGGPGVEAVGLSCTRRPGAHRRPHPRGFLEGPRRRGGGVAGGGGGTRLLAGAAAATRVPPPARAYALARRRAQGAELYLFFREGNGKVGKRVTHPLSLFSLARSDDGAERWRWRAKLRNGRAFLGRCRAKSF
jgi:hypothetical protein